MIAQDFRAWCGDDTFAKFVHTLQTVSKQKGRLTFSQEQTWKAFTAAKGLQLPCELATVNAALAEALRVPNQLEIALPAAIDTFPALLKKRLLDWAEQRHAAGLDLNAVILVRCEPEAADYAGRVIDATFFEDEEVRVRFQGATITGSVQGFPPSEFVSGFAFIVSADGATERGRLGWAIKPRG